MVTTLAHTQHGRQYLAQQGIMDKLSNMIRGAETDTLSSLYLPGKYFFIKTPNLTLNKKLFSSFINKSLMFECFILDKLSVTDA